MSPAPSWRSSSTTVHGHRGAKGIVVENTLASFAAAFDAGVAGVELDVRLTADGELVVWHDPVLQPLKCRATGPDLVGRRVDGLTLAQLRTVDVGSQGLPGFPGQRTVPDARISTLREVVMHGLELAPHAWWTLELKVDPRDPAEAARRDELLDGVLDVVHDLGVDDRCFVHSFNWAVLERAREVAPDVARSALVESGVTWVPDSPWTGGVDVAAHGDDVAAGAAEVGAHVLSPEHVLVDVALVERAHGLGLGVLSWTVNEPEHIRAVVAAGVDGLVSDYPDRALALLAGAG